MACTTRATFASATDFPVEPVRTLDALHLASVLAWDQAVERVTVVSCDDRVRANALALGFDVVPA